MKNGTLRLLGVLTVACGVLAGQTLSAKDSAQVAAYKKTLTTVSALELPAKSASLVSQAGDQERGVATEAVVRAGVALNPAATPAIVGAIAKSNPSVAHIAAKTAVELQPKQIVLIVKAASKAAPSQAGQIVSTLCKQTPAQYNVIAISAAVTVPDASREILKGVTTGLPTLQTYVDKASKSFEGKDLDVAQIINQTGSLVDQARHEQLMASASSSSLNNGDLRTVNVEGAPASAPKAVTFTPAPPVIGPPFTPLPPITTETPADTSPEQPGGHNYSSP